MSLFDTSLFVHSERSRDIFSYRQGSKHIFAYWQGRLSVFPRTHTHKHMCTHRVFFPYSKTSFLIQRHLSVFEQGSFRPWEGGQQRRSFLVSTYQGPPPVIFVFLMSYIFDSVGLEAENNKDVVFVFRQFKVPHLLNTFFKNIIYVFKWSKYSFRDSTYQGPQPANTFFLISYILYTVGLGEENNKDVAFVFRHIRVPHLLHTFCSWMLCIFYITYIYTWSKYIKVPHLLSYAFFGNISIFYNIYIFTVRNYNFSISTYQGPPPVFFLIYIFIFL